MIRADKGEQFPITVSLMEATGQSVPGQIVHYDIRDANDNPLSPTVSGTFIESSVEFGIYRIVENVGDAGTYIIYVTCSGFVTSTEELVINEENIYEITKQTQNYNISVEDVLRTTIPGNETISQLIRKVPYEKTDYLITWIKADDALDWSNPVVSGTVFAWYKTTLDNLPYKMGGKE
jgi:hypothetical protein